MGEGQIRVRTVVDCHPQAFPPEDPGVEWPMLWLRHCRSGRKESVIAMMRRVMMSGRAIFTGFIQKKAEVIQLSWDRLAYEYVARKRSKENGSRNVCLVAVSEATQKMKIL